MTNLTQLYDKEGNPLYPKINLKTINGEALFAEQEGEDITITANSSSSNVKIIFIYSASKDKPDTPIGGAQLTADGIFNYYGIDDGWCNEEEARDKISKNNELLLWSSYITLQYGQMVTGDGNFWSTPSLVTTGSVGVDGSDIKFIYCLTQNSTAPLKCSSTGDTFENSSVKGEWSDEPMGIDETYKYEWISMSVKESGHNKSFGEFTKPSLWSKWGEDGMDGAGVEYVYLLTNSNDTPPPIIYDENEESYQKPEYYPTAYDDVKWSDNYTAPSYDNRYSWVAIRHYKDGKWGKFCEPKLWNVYKVAGKAFADLYRRSDTPLSSDDLPSHANPIYYLFENDKYYSTPDKQNEKLQVGDWYGDVPTEGGRYLYKTQAYVDIVDIDEVVEITKDKWSGPYFISLNGENSNNVNIYITMDNDSFSLPVNETYKTFTGIEYKDSLNANLMYGDNELDIEEDNYDVEYDVNVFDNVDVSLSGKTLKINFKIKNNIEIKNVEYISITLRGNYNNKEYEAKKSFKIIPYVSTIGEFYKIRVNDDTVYVDKSNNGGTWKHKIVTELVDSKGNKINPNDIDCYFTYSTQIGDDVSTFIKDESGIAHNLYVYADDIGTELSNPLCIKLKDFSTDTEREVEYIDFVNMPQDGSPGSPGSPGISMYTEYAFTSINPNLDISTYTVSGGGYSAPLQNLETRDSYGYIVNNIIWSDTLPKHIPGNSIWMIKKIYSSNDNSFNGVWDKPVRIMDSEHLQVEYCASTNNPANGITQMSVLATNNPTLTIDKLEELFRNTEASTRGFTWGDENISDPTWMAVSKLAGGSWSDWTVTRIKGEKGDPGENGKTPYHIEIENEFDIISTTDNITNAGQSITTNIKLLEGNLDRKFKAVDIDIPEGGVFSNDVSIICNGEKNNYTNADITIYIKDNVKVDKKERYSIAVKVLYDNEYDDSSTDEWITSFITLRVMNTSEVYQLEVTPGFVNDNEDTSIFAKIYKKGVDGIYFINNDDASNLGLQIKYLTDNDEEKTITTIDMADNYNVRDGKWSVYDYKKENGVGEIDIRLYKGDTLYDNVNVEVKPYIQPSMQFELSPVESIVYLNDENNPIATTLRLKGTLAYEGKIVSSLYGATIQVEKNYKSIIKNVNNIGNIIDIDIDAGVSPVNESDVKEFSLKVSYGKAEKEIPININFVNSNLVISGIDMIPLLYASDSDYVFKGSFSYNFTFNGSLNLGNSITDYGIDINEIDEQNPLRNYLENDNISLAPSTAGFNIFFKATPDENFSIVSFIDNDDNNGIIKVPFYFKYNNIKTIKDLYLYSLLKYERNYEIEIMGSHYNSIDEDKTDEGIIICPKYDKTDYNTFERLLDKNIILTVKIDDDDEIEYTDINKLRTIPRYNGLCIFYPDGYSKNGFNQPIIHSKITFKLINKVDNRIEYINTIERRVPIKKNNIENE